MEHLAGSFDCQTTAKTISIRLLDSSARIPLLRVHSAPARLYFAPYKHGSRERLKCRLAKGRSQPAESSWEAEFSKYADPQRLHKMSKHLELTWKVSKVGLIAYCFIHSTPFPEH
jgi:hypothetical protein